MSNILQQVRRAGGQTNTDLNYDYEPEVLGEDIERAFKCLIEAATETSGYKEGDFDSLTELKQTILDEVSQAFDAEFKND